MVGKVTHTLKCEYDPEPANLYVFFGVNMSKNPYLGYFRTLWNSTRVNIHSSRRRPAPQQEGGMSVLGGTLAVIRRHVAPEGGASQFGAVHSWGIHSTRPA